MILECEPGAGKFDIEMCGRAMGKKSVGPAMRSYGVARPLKRAHLRPVHEAGTVSNPADGKKEVCRKAPRGKDWRGNFNVGDVTIVKCDDGRYRRCRSDQADVEIDVLLEDVSGGDVGVVTLLAAYLMIQQV
jgi:hypothetical protein